MAAWAFVLSVGSAGAGCYKPNLDDGGLLCGPARSCPDGYTCRRNGKCYAGPPPVCTAAKPFVEQICEPTAGTDCDPICQSRCDCGRCNLVGTGLDCTPPGNKDTGAICNLQADDCKPGNVCIKDCSKTIGRCYRFCGTDVETNDAACGESLCDIQINDQNDQPTPYYVCEPPSTSCNPVGPTNDCGSSELGCYITSTGKRVCDCKGADGPGGACGPYNSCIPGYRCISFGSMAKCFQTCSMSSPTDCTAPEICKQAPGSAAYGYCDLP
jgi:hypothetical protein